MTTPRKDRGAWSRQSIAADCARFERAHPLPRYSGDGLPTGMSPEDAERLGLVSGALPWTSDDEPTGTE